MGHWPVKKVLRYIVMLPGLLYLWALLPVSFRPQYTGSPLRKSDSTVNVDLVPPPRPASAHRRWPPRRETGLSKLSKARLKQACEPPLLLKPIVRPAHQVVVRYTNNGKVVAEKIFDCSNYT